MPRRKQQEPRRSAAYMPEDELKAATHDEEEHLQDDGLSLDGQDTEFLCNEEEEDLDGGRLPSYRDSPLSNGTNPDAGYGSPLSDTSDRLADFKSTSSRDGQERDGNALCPSNNGISFQDSLAKMKAVYANLISDASWSSITMDIMKSKSAAASSLNSVLTTASTVPVSITTTTNKSSGTSVASSHHNGKSSGSTVNHTGSSTGTTNGIAASTVSSQSATSSSGTSSGSASNGSGVAYDWHQAALAKTLQQTPYHLLPEPSLFSTVQLYRQNNKLYGSVFTGASKFRCKDCSAAYDTLVGLTVHMNETGHYRDDNKDKEEEQGKRWSKPRKRSLMEMEGKEDAQKVLKCMYCGHSFESLQDLSVHMIKTKHYQKVPLKEPVPALATKLVPTSAKKRAIQDSIVSPCSPDPVHAAGGGSLSLGDPGKDSKATANPYVTPNNRYGYQNGASYTWQFEARKAQILKCMECGSSHDTLQQLTAHMMVTGHFLKVTNSASKKGKQLVFDPVVEEKIQSIPLPPTTTRLPVPCSVKSQPVSPALSSASEEKREGAEEDKVEGAESVERKIKEEKDDSGDRSESDTTSYKYLREEDLEETPKEGLDILKSLENTVSSAISKAQTGAPTWGGYPSIHAAYQLQGVMKSSTTVLPPTIQSVQMQPMFNSGLRGLVNDPNSVIHSPRSPSSPTPLRSNVTAMEELVEKVTGKAVKKEKEEKMVSLERCRPPSLVKSPSPALREHREQLVSPNDLSVGKPSGMRSSSPGSVDSELICKKEPKESLVDSHSNHSKNGSETCRSPVTNGNSLGIITDHSPESPFVNPLSALQSIMNTHLGKASKPVSPAADPLSMLYKISNSMMEKPAFNPSSQGKPAEPISQYQLYENNDQPIDLSKHKSFHNTNSNNNNNNSSVLLTNNSVNGNKPIISLSESVSSPLRENALMDISDMVKNLTGRLTPKSSTPSSISEKSDAEGSAFEDALEDLSPVQKRKGRQSNWNPQHLLILQAQFASSLRETPEGRYAMTDLGPQERVHICKFTGLSMTTISHWLANVKYQLRRTGGTKFLKNMDSCQPVFLCGDCASQFRTPSAYISHLESHLGFSMKDLSKLSSEHLREQQAASKVITDKMTFGSPLSALTTPEDDTSSVYQCRLCNRTFVSKHAVKLHLSKTHGKSPEDHLVFVSALEKLEKLDKIEKV